MKWLILILLMACGKHEEPKKLDLRDSDGDQVLNHQEEDLNKYVADFETLGKVRGVLKFNLDKIIEIPVSNELNIKNEALSLIVSNDKRLKEEDYFTEWSNLRLDNIPHISGLKSSHYLVHLYFENGSDEARELLLQSDSEMISLGKWSQVMKLHLSRKNIEDLLTGKAFFSLKKDFNRSRLFGVKQDGTIKEKTYRVHFFDGKKSRILYVAKTLAFSELLKLMDISEARAMNETEVFFDSDELKSDEWFTRELSNGNKVIAYSNIKDLKNMFLQKYTYKRQVLSRVNGEAVSNVTFNNKSQAQIFVRISSARFTERRFVEKQERRLHGGGGGGGREGGASAPYKCTHYLRNIQSENSVLADLETLFTNINQRDALLSSVIEEEMNNHGIYWEMKLEDAQEQLEWKFINRVASTYTITGEYNNSCGDAANRGRGAAYKTNLEGKFETVIETFVEKMEE